MRSWRDRVRFQSARMTLRLLAPEDRAEYLRVHEVSRAAFSKYMPLPPEGKTPEQLFDDRIRNAVAGVDERP